MSKEGAGYKGKGQPERQDESGQSKGHPFLETKNASDLKTAGISIFPNQIRLKPKPKQIKAQHAQPQMRR